MKIRPLAVLSALLLAAPVFAQTQTQTQPAASNDPRIPAIIHSLQQVRSVRETQLSPDGNYIAWDISKEGVYLAPLSDPAHARHVTACAADAEGDEKSLAWSPDSATLAFLSNCGKDGKIEQNRMAIYTVAASGSNSPHLLAQLNGYAKSLRYSPTGKLLSFLYEKGATRPSGALAPEPLPVGVIGVEHIAIQRIAAVNASTGLLAEITPANLFIYEYNWSPDSNHLAYTAAPPPGEDNWWTAKLYVQPLTAGPNGVPAGYARGIVGGAFRAVLEPKVVFDPNTSTGPLHGLQIAVPRWSPDGSKIAFIAGLMSDQGVTGGDIYVIPSSGGAPKDVIPNRPASPEWFKWIDEQTLGIAEIKAAQSHLFVYNIDTQQESPDYNVTVPGVVGAGGLMMRISTSSGNNIAFIKSSFSEPPEVYAGPIDNLRQITHFNDGLKPSWGKSEPISWTNENFHIDGWLLYPANYDPAKKYPLIVYVHGGPSYANLARWPSAGFGPAPFSALGYFVLMPNPRGSFGEGEKFTQADRKDFGYGDLRDILAGVDAVVKTRSVDPNRVGITGWSYGGFMTMFAITQTHRFHAAVAGAGISDWKSYYGENSIDQWMIPFFGASVYDDPAVYAKSSAINYIKNAKTPTLIVVGDRDGECPAPQSFELWHALRYEHVPTELVVYADEGHGFHKPADRINVLERALGWFDQYMPGSSEKAGS
ncbi:MAG: S9 family peptidase [Acidobacteriaceae bacterium]